MSEPAGILDAQVQTLLALVEQHRATHCARLAAEAREQRGAILHQAHHDARDRMREAIRSERLRTREKLEATAAQLQTRERQQQHKTALLMLHRGWERLGDAALRRWKAPPQRHEWICALIKLALERLPPRPWVIEHPPGWDPDECAELRAAMEQHCGAAPQLRADDQLHAGLRICTDGACLDGTLEGLLADREAIEAQLLAQLNELLRSREERQ